MPAAARTLAIALVTLAGLAAGFFCYRGASQRDSRPPVAPVTSGSANSPDAAAGAPAGTDSGSADAEPQSLTGRPIPDSVPDLKLPDLAGEEKSLREFLGRPLIINFWATWCAPCRSEIPLLLQLRQVYRGEGLRIVGIAVDFRAAVADYVSRRAIDYPLLIGEDQGLAAAEQFGMHTVLPFSVFADAQGRIIAVKIGELHRDEADYILGAMRALAAGHLSLPEAHAGIAQRLRELAVERARAGANDS
jgi:thiol-disulfide isomerase/thioredoxin